MQREEATSLLRELFNASLIQPLFVHLEQNKHGRFDLIIKCDCDVIELRKFITAKDLALLVDSEKGTCRIYRP